MVGRKRRVGKAVHEAEARTGLQFCVYLGPPRDPTELFEQAQPAVLVMVVPEEQRVEIVTSPEARERVPDEACRAAIDHMLDDFRARRYDRGIVRGVEHLAAVAGGGTAAEGSEDLPDVLG